jgi:hypothetical protein
MKIKYFVVLAVIVFATVVFANDIQYPVAELGNCKNQAECKTFCDKEKNMESCLNFAEKNNLMSAEEIKLAKNFMATKSNGPGGCTSKDSCEQYCNDMGHMDECISFAEKNNLMSTQELEEAKKVQAAIAKGAKPPACGNKKNCDVYCEAPEHMEECINFGQAAGFIQGKELEDAQKMLEAVKRGVKAPNCKGKEACDEYCSKPENMEICMNFAMEAGFMGEQEKADAQKMLQAIKKGVNPPNCKNKEECDAYCGQEEHFEECTAFAEAAGFMTTEEATMARKTGGKGPGGCTNKEECKAFCNNPDNKEICFNFGKENGMISEEDLKKIEEGKQQIQQMLNQVPQEVLNCLQSEVGADMVEKMKNGALPPQEIGEKMQKCFQKMAPIQGSSESGQGGAIPPAGQGGQNFQQPQPIINPTNQEPGGSNSGGGMGMPGTDANQGGPVPNIQSPCTTPEECQQMFGPALQGGQQPQQPMPGQQPQPSTEPGSGGNIQPGIFVPPIEQQPQITPFLQSGSILQIFLDLFSPPRK